MGDVPWATVLFHYSVAPCAVVHAESHARASHVRDYHSYHRHYQNLLILSMVLFIIFIDPKMDFMTVLWADSSEMSYVYKNLLSLHSRETKVNGPHLTASV